MHKTWIVHKNIHPFLLSLLSRIGSRSVFHRQKKKQNSGKKISSNIEYIHTANVSSRQYRSAPPRVRRRLRGRRLGPDRGVRVSLQHQPRERQDPQGALRGRLRHLPQQGRGQIKVFELGSKKGWNLRCGYYRCRLHRVRRGSGAESHDGLGAAAGGRGRRDAGRHEGELRHRARRL